MIGIFNARVMIEKKDGIVQVTIDGATDSAGIGEALGFAASCWLASSNEVDYHKELHVILGAFVTLATQRGGIKHEGGSVQVVDVGGTIPPGGRVS